jgi:hypothetical protein
MSSQQNIFRLAIGAFALLLALPLVATADEKPPLPDQKDLLPQLQKIGGKDWAVTATSDGFLLTYAKPVVVYSSNAVISQAALAEQLKGKTEPFHIKIVIAPPLTAAQLNRPNNPYSERPDVPMDPAAVRQLNQSHFFICSPTSWASDSKYTVYVTSNETSEQSIYPSKSSDDYDQMLADLGSLFHF